MKKYLAFAMLLLVSCNFTNEDKARSLIKESMKKTLLIADSYEAVETKLDSAFTPYDSSEFFENVIALAQCGMETDKAQKDANRAKSSMAIWSRSYMDAFSRNQYREYKYKYEKAIAEEETATENMQKIVDKIRKMLQDPSIFIGYKAVHTYRAKNNAGQVLMGHALFLFDKELIKIIAQYDMDSEEYILSGINQKNRRL